MHISLSVVGLVSVYFFVSTAACPEGCSCGQKYVDCNNAGLTAIPWNLPNPVGLERINLQGNEIHELFSEIVSYTNLKYLDLSNNGMLSVDENVFASLPNLRVLNLKDNEINRIQHDTFRGLIALEELDLSGNELERIEGSPFSDLTKLQDLDLSDNVISSISETAFLGLNNLRSLSLTSNQLDSIPIASFGHISGLSSLMLESNAIQTIPPSSFSELKALRVLNLDGNRIREISEFAFSDKFQISIEHFSLRSNSFSRIPSESLYKFRNLRSVDFSGNPVVVIDPDAFKGLDRLQEISLQSMPELEVVRSYAFSELQSLQIVHLNSNPKLRAVEKDSFLASTASLKYVDLHGNALTSLDTNLLDWNRLEFLDLRHNNWICDCNLNFLPDVLKSNVNKSLSRQVTCSAPDDLIAKSIVDLSSGQMECDVQVKKLKRRHHDDQIMVAVIAGVSCMLLILMIVLMVRSRHTTFGTGQMPVTYWVRGREADRTNVDLDTESNARLAIALSEERPEPTLPNNRQL